VRSLDEFRMGSPPNYLAQGNEEKVFLAAWQSGMPLLLKGPTGCGKTRFLEAMAYKLKQPLITVSCHEDLTASDLVGRFLFKNNETVWHDGPLALAARHGGICYLDEIVEARKDTTVVIHSLTDDRRTLFVDKTGEVIRAHKNFMMALSYNPGYQSVVKDLKPSTRQRFISLNFDHPSVATECDIIRSESGLNVEDSRKMAEMGAKIRQLKGFGLTEGVSSRLLVYAGRLIRAGLPPVESIRHAIGETLGDDPQGVESIMNLAQLYFGDLLAEEARHDESALSSDAEERRRDDG